MKTPNLNSFCKEVFEANKLKGFDVSKENVGQTLMLVVSELAEALEADRKDRKADVVSLDKDIREWSSYDDDYPGIFRAHVKDTFEDEIADSFIRLFDLCGGLGIDIDRHIELKLRYNSMREHKHGKKY